MMVYQALRDGFPARAAAVYGAFTDLAGLLADPRWQPVAERIWPDFEARKEQIIDRRSALRWADRISVPVLIMQGGEDGSVPPTQSLDLAAKLLAANKPFDLWIANGAGHVMTERAAERDERAIAWFVRYATAAGKPDGG